MSDMPPLLVAGVEIAAEERDTARSTARPDIPCAIRSRLVGEHPAHGAASGSNSSTRMRTETQARQVSQAGR